MHEFSHKFLKLPVIHCTIIKFYGKHTCISSKMYWIQNYYSKFPYLPVIPAVLLRIGTMAMAMTILIRNL